MKNVVQKIVAGIIFAIAGCLIFKLIGFEIAVLTMLVAIYVEVLIGDKDLK